MTSVKKIRALGMEKFLATYAQHLEAEDRNGVVSRLITAVYPHLHEAMNKEIDDGRPGDDVFAAVVALLTLLVADTARMYAMGGQLNSAQAISILIHETHTKALELVLKAPLADIPTGDMGQA